VVTQACLQAATTPHSDVTVPSNILLFPSLIPSHENFSTTDFHHRNSTHISGLPTRPLKFYHTMSSPPSTSAPQSTIHKTTLLILAAYEHQSIEEIMSFLTPDCTHIILPSSLTPPPMGNTTYSTFFAAVIPRIWNFKVSVSEIIESPQ
jgi:hypothetical protein